MPNRNLTAEELEKANALLAEIRGRLTELAGEDRELLFAYRRKIGKELGYDERSKPSIRKRLKALKRKEQGGLCTVCNEPLAERGNVLDRVRAVDGYTAANTRLIHSHCDANIQTSRGYR